MRYIIILLSVMLLSACSSDYFGGPAEGSAPVPHTWKGKVKVGKPYKIMGKWYYPSHQPDYDETGVASWYGPNFHGKSTANGETFDQYALTAAHPTLPLPSFVRVTNLDNGKTLIVRINDRGPFKSNRIIDLSKASAQKVGMIGTGTANVRVQYLPQVTQAYLNGHRMDEYEIAALERGEQSVLSDVYVEPVVGGQPESYVQAQERDVTSSGRMMATAAPVGSVFQSDLPRPDVQVRPVYRTEVYDSAPPVHSPTRQVTAQRLAPAPAPSEQAETVYVPAYDAPPIVPEPEPGIAVERVRAPSIYQRSIAPVQTPTQTPAPIVARANDIPIYEPVTPKEPMQYVPPPATRERLASPDVVTKPKIAQQPSLREQLYVQAGSFSVSGNAHKLSQKLESIARANVHEVRVNGKTWYRVTVGPAKDKQQAQQILASVRGHGINDARIVQE